VGQGLAHLEEGRQDERELPGDVVLTGLGGSPDGSDQVRVLGVAPGQRVLVAAEGQRLVFPIPVKGKSGFRLR
jgi:hypothetical protein